MPSLPATRVLGGAALAALAVLTSPPLTMRAAQVRPVSAPFAVANGQGVLLPMLDTAPAVDRAAAFIDLHGGAFGVASRSDVRLVRAPHRDEVGIDHVRFQQLHLGVPVTGAEFLVHLKGARVVAANGRLLDRLPEDVTPAVLPATAWERARTLIAKHRPDAAPGANYAAPRLEIFNRGLLEGTSSPSRLAWFVEATGRGLREFIWVDAKTGALLLNFNQYQTARDRRVYTVGGGFTLPGTLVRSEGGAATGNADQDAAYDLSGVTYDYFFSMFGRDSYDNAGGLLVSTTQYDDGLCPNAFWNGQQMVYCQGFASADDVVAHELTHGVIQYSANLFYFMQSGALNESFADIFGETVDLTHVTAGDTAGVRWSVGEDLPFPVGTVRDMMDPTVFGNPGKMSDAAYFSCDPTSDAGGVHGNSGVPNHAYALMVDGGSYNGQTVSGIGLDKAARIQYRALTTYLTTASTFLDNHNALNQSCSDLVGAAGITVADCAQVHNALLAVEMNASWGCMNPMVEPAVCPAGGTPSFTFQDGFETVSPPWTTGSISASQWSTSDTQFVRAGARTAWGPAPDELSDHYLAMASAILIPANGRMIFDHAFDFETIGGFYFDGGVLEYSANNGATWNDAAPLIDGGVRYGGAIFDGFGNTLANLQAFVGATFGFKQTRLNLASLAGQSVRFRFRIGTDLGVPSYGWFVDDVGIYTCTVAPGAPVLTSPPTGQTAGPGASATFTVVAGGSPTLRYQWLKNGSAIPNATSVALALTNVQHMDYGYYSVIVSNDIGTATSDAVPLTPVNTGSWGGITDFGLEHNFTVAPSGQSITQLQVGTFFACQNYSATINASIPIDGQSASFSYDSGVNTCGARVQTSGSFQTSGSAQGAVTFTLDNSGPGCAITCSDSHTLGWFAASGAPVMSKQPASRTVTVGQNTQFAVEAAGFPDPTFQWQISTNGGGAWTDLTNAAPYSGVTTKTLVIIAAPIGLNNALYRAVADNGVGAATSDAAVLNVLAANLLANGDFSTGDLAGWSIFATPDLSYIVASVVGGVLNYHRVPSPGNQAVVFQTTGVSVGTTPLLAQFDLGNSSSVRKRVSVLLVDSDFSDLAVCTFWLAPNTPLATYRMRTHATKPWADAAIYFYAATAGADGGNYLLDNVSVQYDPAGSNVRTDCVDPTVPAPPGGSTGANLLSNGDFSGGLASWGLFGQIASQVSSGVFEFVRQPGSPAGVILQATGAAVVADEFLTATFDLGNTSAVRKRVTALVHDNDFSDLAACTFWLPPGLPLSTFQMRMRATEAWTNATLSIYPATVGLEPWMRLDNVILRRTPSAAILGTECLEPVETVVPPFLTAGDAAASVKAAGTVLPSGMHLDEGPQRLRFWSWLPDMEGLAEVQVSLDGETWTTLVVVPPGDTWSDIEVDLSEYAGLVIHVRFVYTPATGEAPRVWRVANVKVSGG